MEAAGLTMEYLDMNKHKMNYSVYYKIMDTNNELCIIATNRRHYKDLVPELEGNKPIEHNIYNFL